MLIEVEGAFKAPWESRLHDEPIDFRIKSPWPSDGTRPVDGLFLPFLKSSVG
jgi:hypothetical protein